MNPETEVVEKLLKKSPPSRDYIKLSISYLVGALLNEGWHHKNWYVEQALMALVGEKGLKEIRKALQEEDYDWQDGIAP